MKKKQQHRYDMVSVVRLTFNLFMAIAECVLQQIGYCCVVMPFFVITSKSNVCRMLEIRFF